MRIALLMILALLAGCNSSDNDDNFATQQQVSAIPNEATQVAALRAQVSAMQTKLADLQVIGKIKNGSTAGISPEDFRTMGELAIAPVSFGPCANMGIFQGTGGSDSSNPLASQFEIYKQIANAQTGCPASVTSYNEITGLHDRLPFTLFSGPGCTGTLYVPTDDITHSMSLSALENILVMMSSDPSDNTVYASRLGSTPQSINIQSDFNAAPGGGCSVDIATRIGVEMVHNDVNVSGVPDSLVPGSWTKASP